MARSRGLARARFRGRFRQLGLTLFFGDRQNQLRIVIGGVIDPRRDLVPGEFANFGPSHQRRDFIDIMRPAVEPKLEILRLDRYRHARMQRGEIGACRRRHDRRRVDFLAIGAGPGLRHAGKGNRTAVTAINEKGPLGMPGGFPLVITVRRNEAASAPDRILERRLFAYRLLPCIDQERKITGILDPGRPQAPAHQLKVPAISRQDHRYWLCWRDIKSGREIRTLRITENLPQGIRWRGDQEASAHWGIMIGKSSTGFNPHPQHCGR